VPQFANINDRATQVGQEHYQMMMSRPVGDDCDGDMSGIAEDAQDQAIGWYEMMRSLRQTMLNLLAAGLFHLTEQRCTKMVGSRFHLQQIRISIKWRSGIALISVLISKHFQLGR